MCIVSSANNYGESQVSNDNYSPNPILRPSTFNISSSGFLPILNGNNTTPNIEKTVIVMFDRGYENQFITAKPILDKYRFKATFFVICNLVDLADGKEISKKGLRHDYIRSMDWDQVKTLYEEGHDIESHGMNHKELQNLAQRELEDEVSESRYCLEYNGLQPTYFQIPFNRGAENATILKVITRYFDFGLSGHSELMFLNCDGWVNHGFKMRSYKNQHDCNPYGNNGTITGTNKFSIKEWSHDRFHNKLNNRHVQFDPHGNEINDMMFNEFVRVVEAQNIYNSKAGKIVAIPIIGYHKIDNSSSYDTSIELFDREMKYLYDNGFRVLKLTDLGYYDDEHRFYIK